MSVLYVPDEIVAIRNKFFVCVVDSIFLFSSYSILLCVCVNPCKTKLFYSINLCVCVCVLRSCVSVIRFDLEI